MPQYNSNKKLPIAVWGSVFMYTPISLSVFAAVKRVTNTAELAMSSGTFIGSCSRVTLTTVIIMMHSVFKTDIISMKIAK